MADNKIVIFGAGMTGRGHIAQLAYESGWKITFVEKNPELVKLLKRHGSYTVKLISESPRDVVISGYDVFELNDDLHVVSAIAESDMVVTSVLPNNLPGVAPILAEGLRFRIQYNNDPLNVIAAENMIGASNYLWLMTSPFLSFDEKSKYGTSFGFPNSMIARVVPQATDPLTIFAEDYNEWTADKLSCVGKPKPLNGLEWVENHDARLKRKLYVHNLGHAICAYLGALKGYTFVHEAAQDDWIMSCAKNAMLEAGTALIKEFNFSEQEIASYIEDLLRRMTKDALPDSVNRVIRNPIRKLKVNDRFTGPLSLCEKFDLPCKWLCLGIAAVLVSRPFDEEGLRLSAIVKEKGASLAFQEVSGYAPNRRNADQIQNAYELLLNNIAS